MWTRLCPLCEALLRKFKLSDSIRCGCGWEWLTHDFVDHSVASTVRPMF